MVTLLYSHTQQQDLKETVFGDTNRVSVTCLRSSVGSGRRGDAIFLRWLRVGSSSHLQAGLTWSYSPHSRFIISSGIAKRSTQRPFDPRGPPTEEEEKFGWDKSWLEKDAAP
ncbi:hypothetical protein AVEN_104116-1 [Araneus ventricosus]|uniref:Uncharacterized protein n=1 Tax=Araneus ventricosus TaxID=182803 RepID=A0A4Y2J9A2_ARAVE|nr:hypothetical protein AVEN_104116-1 [Araneus ventricosus]